MRRITSMRTAVAVALAAALAGTLAGCSSGGRNLEDPKTLSTVVPKRAVELGSSDVVELTLNSIRGKGSTTGFLSVTTGKGAGALVSKPVVGDGAGPTDSNSPGMPADELPYAELTKLYLKTKQACEGKEAYGTFTTLSILDSGSTYTSAGCTDPKAARPQPSTALLDGKPVEKLPDLTSAAAWDTMLAEARKVVGDDAARLNVIWVSMLGPDEPPQVTADGTGPCSSLYARTTDDFSPTPSCSTAPATESGAPVPLARLTGAAVADAIARAKTEAGVPAGSELISAEVIGRDDGSFGLRYAADGMKLGVVPVAVSAG